MGLAQARPNNDFTSREDLVHAVGGSAGLCACGGSGDD